MHSLGGNNPCDATELWAEMLVPEQVEIGNTASVVPDPACGNYSDADSWFSFEAPSGGDVAIQLFEGSITDAAFALYEGPCDELVELQCVSDYLCGQEPMPAYFFEDLEAGETYYLRIWNSDGPIAGDLDIIIANPSGNPYITTGSATEISFQGSSNCIELTPPTTGQAGCAWYPEELDFSEPFEQTFSIYLGDIQGQAGADGMTIIYTSENIPTCGNPGSGIGYEGIPASIGVEFDTYINGPPYIDPAQDHSAISINGDMFNHISGPVGLGSIADGLFHEVEVSWNPTSQRFQVWFDGTLIHDVIFDFISQAFSGETSVNWGVSASTGGAFNQHILCFENLELDNLSDVYTTDSLAICEGESVFLEGALQTDPGTFVDIFPAANGCDSIHTTYLEVIPLSPPTEIEVELCPGESHFYEGEFYNQDGTYDIILTDQRGCDSLVELTIILNELDAILESTGPLNCDRDSTQIYLTVFQGDPYQYRWSVDGSTDTILVGNPGVYWLDVTYASNCTWSESIEINAEPGTIESFDTLGLCVGGSLQWRGDTIEQAGDYEYRMDSVPHPFCNTVFYLHVFESGDYVMRSDTSHLCPNDTLLWQGLTIDTAGVYEDTIVASDACDTLAFLYVKPQPFINVRDSLERCPDEEIVWRGLQIDSAGYYEQLLPASEGCDTLAALWVTTNPFTETSDSIFICPGKDTSWRGNAIDTVGTYNFQFESSSGCDTLATLFVGELPTPTKSDTLFRCIGDTILAYGRTWDTAGVYQLQLPASIGCDTSLILEIIDLPLPRRIDSVTLCPMEDTLWYGNRIDEPGTYSRRLPSSVSCDSIAILVVDTLSYPVKEQTIERCPTDILEIGGLVIDTGGYYESFLPATQGCDTLLQLLVVDVPLIQIRDSVGLCPDQSLQWRSLSIDSSGDYELRLASEEACDTLAFLHVFPLPLVQDTLQINKCEGDTLYYESLTITDAGEYQVTVPANVGCDTLKRLFVAETPLTTIQKEVVLCENETFSFLGNELAPDSTYQFSLPGNEECDTIFRIEVTREPLITPEIQSFGDLCEGPVLLRLSGVATSQLNWGNWSPIGSGADSIWVSVPGQYEWSGTTPAGCDIVDRISVAECAPCNISIPNVFSPNGDGINDIFELSASCGISSFQARIFDRWGKLITESRDPQLIWDGGDYQNGVFVFQIQIQFIHPDENKPRVFHGSITLMR